jgi:hypothetical protein
VFLQTVKPLLPKRHEDVFKEALQDRLDCFVLAEHVLEFWFQETQELFAFLKPKFKNMFSQNKAIQPILKCFFEDILMPLRQEWFDSLKEHFKDKGSTDIDFFSTCFEKKMKDYQYHKVNET